MIGREAELSELNRSLARAAEGTATLISGVPGVGKTTLLEAALAGLDGLPDGPVVVRARANPADRELAYVSLVDALCSVLDRIDAQTRDQVLEGLDSLGPLLEGYGLAASPGGGDSGGGGALERTRRLTGLRRLLARIGRTRGALLVLDDAHWADAATLEAIAHLSRELQDAGFSLCLLYRDDEVGPQLRRVIAQLRRVRGGVEVRLDALGLEETRRLAEQLLTAPVTDPLAELLHQRSAGIPLFTVALAELLARRDLLVREGGRLVPAAGAADVVPDEAHDLLMTRLADLSDSARTVLDTVAVAGGPVLRRRVLGVTGMAPDALDEAIRTLQRVALVRVDSEEADSVEIAHPLLAEAVDHRVASRSRALIHRRFADELEADPTADVGRLARHVQEAGGEIDPERALPILFIAGERALTRMAGVEAVSHFQAAFELCE
ncbi:MAG: AAA family ATPase, partial [Microthrixaceae bacterium]|nr:AAA family ATPase [Microthrixaceae bacterium]